MARPRAFFAEDGTMPEEVELSLELPEVFVAIYGVKQVRAGIAEAVEAHEAKAQSAAAAKGWAFKGADRVRKGSPYSRAKTLEDRRRFNPRYAGEAEAVESTIAQDASFRARYATARERWLAVSATSCGPRAPTP